MVSSRDLLARHLRGDHHRRGGAGGFSVVDGFDVVAVGVQDEGGVVAGVVGAGAGAPLSRPPAASAAAWTRSTSARDAVWKARWMRDGGSPFAGVRHSSSATISAGVSSTSWRPNTASTVGVEPLAGRQVGATQLDVIDQSSAMKLHVVLPRRGF